MKINIKYIDFEYLQNKKYKTLQYLLFELNFETTKIHFISKINSKNGEFYSPKKIKEIEFIQFQNEISKKYKEVDFLIIKTINNIETKHVFEQSILTYFDKNKFQDSLFNYLIEKSIKSFIIEQQQKIELTKFVNEMKEKRKIETYNLEL